MGASEGPALPIPATVAPRTSVSARAALGQEGSRSGRGEIPFDPLSDLLLMPDNGQPNWQAASKGDWVMWSPRI